MTALPQPTTLVLNEQAQRSPDTRPRSRPGRHRPCSHSAPRWHGQASRELQRERRLERAAELPELSPAQTTKLKKLTVVALAAQSKTLAYDVLLRELEVRARACLLAACHRQRPHAGAFSHARRRERVCVCARVRALSSASGSCAACASSRTCSSSACTPGCCRAASTSRQAPPTEGSDRAASSSSSRDPRRVLRRALLMV